MTAPLYDDRIDGDTAATLLEDLGGERDSQRYTALSADDRLEHHLTIEDGDDLGYRLEVRPAEMKATRGWKSGISYLLNAAMDRLTAPDPHVFEGTIPEHYDLEGVLDRDRTEHGRYNGPL